MIEAVEVERFRGLRQLKVGGLGRVNLIIGRNNSGKTALMEALNLAVNVGVASSELIAFQQYRRPDLPIADLEQFWLPLFWRHNAEIGFTIRARTAEGTSNAVDARKVEAREDVITKARPRLVQRTIPWSIELRLQYGTEDRRERIDATSDGVRLPSSRATNEVHSLWAFPHRDVGGHEIRCFSRLKQSGSEPQLLEILREVDAQVSGIELLSPTGAEAEIFVRLGSSSPLLSIGMMGDGFQRCFEIGVVAMEAYASTLFVDEFENGLHHSVLEPVWRWLASISTTRDLQIFATTHSEECVQAACRAFTAASDDGLRVIRLDRREEETVATVYDRSLVEAATRMGVEIRG